MIVVSIAIQKGGSGKTTTALNLAAALRDHGKKVMLIDLDPQANLTQSLGVSDKVRPNTCDALKMEAFGEMADLAEILVPTGGMDLAPASQALTGVELELVSIYGREQLLAQILNRFDHNYDYVLIDCPPSFGMLTVNALVASHHVILPLQAEYLPLQGVNGFVEYLNKNITRLNPQLNLLGFVLTKYDRRKKMNRQIFSELTDLYGNDKLFDTVIRTNIDLAYAQQQGVDIFSYRATCHGAEDYHNLGLEFLQKIEKHEKFTTLAQTSKSALTG